MDHSDLVSILIAIGILYVTAVGGLIKWLLMHSTRLTQAEVRVENNALRITDNANRTAADFNDIKGSLIRIEDLVSRQHQRRTVD